MASLRLILLATLIVACQDTSLQSGGNFRGAYDNSVAETKISAISATESNEISAPSEAVQNIAGAPIEPTNPDPDPEPSILPNLAPNPPLAEEFPNALVPISIGGASLTCSFNPMTETAAICFARNKAGEPLEGLSKGFIVHGTPALWKPTTIIASDIPGKYSVTIVDGLKDDFGIALIYELDKAVFDWISPLGLSHYSIVKDGGFENYLIGPTASALQLPSSESPSWQAIPTANSNCPKDSPGFIEIQNSRVPGSLPPINEGKQWLELDAVCSDATLGNAGNMKVFQDLIFNPSNFYLVRFSVVRRLTDTGLESMTVSMGADVIYERDTLVNVWTTYTSVIEAGKGSLRLQFEEKGLANRSGTLIDSVQVIDLGANKQAL